MNAETRSEMFGRLLKKIPNPTTELNYSTSFELLVAVTLSAQATDKSVNQVTDVLFPLANTPETIFKLGEDTLRDTIKTIGLFNSKAKHIIQTCKILIDKYGSKVPETRKELEALPGVGRKTANVVLNTAFDQPTIAVDTHIYRVANRTAIASGKTVLEVEKKLIKFIPDEFKVPAHHLMILHGRYVCKARSPHCTTPSKLSSQDRIKQRQFLVRSWQKFTNKESLEPLEILLTSIIQIHPEYHELINNVDSDYFPEQGEVNPFLRINLHLALRDQLSINQPSGIKGAYDELLAKLKDEHAVEHLVMDCITEMILSAQMDGAPIDHKAYYQCIQHQVDNN